MEIRTRSLVSIEITQGFNDSPSYREDRDLFDKTVRDLEAQGYRVVCKTGTGVFHNCFLLAKGDDLAWPYFLEPGLGGDPETIAEAKRKLFYGQ